MPRLSLNALQTALERWLLLWLVALSFVAYHWPRWFDPTRVADPFLAGGAWLGILIAVTMLAVGSLLPREEVGLVVRRWPMVIAGTAIQYTAMPLLAFGLGKLFGLEGPWLIGIIMVGCVPGAMASNVLTLIARGNVSYSVGLTTSATILSPLVVPWTLWLTVGHMVEDFPALKVCGDLCWMVVLPVVCGYQLSRLFTAWRAVASRMGAIIANLTILWIIAVVVAANREMLSQVQAPVFSALLAVNLGGYLAGYFGGVTLGLPESMRRALTLEIGMQNAGLGTTLAMRLFPDEPGAALPAAIYTFGCMCTGTILARLWAEAQRRTDARRERTSARE
ncbi:MAG: bile acid:sodium symporter family protein [Rhodopirellula sp.]|nr:bile acid:sodium symporter family protein [Rhodopirellula sp.]